MNITSTSFTRFPQADFPKVANKPYRAAIYFLLLLVLGGSILLSATMEHTIASVQHDSQPLLREKIPELHNVAHYESSLLRYQLALNKYYSLSISHQRYQTLEETCRNEMSRNFALLARSFGGRHELDTIDAHYQRLIALGPQLERNVQLGASKANNARALLAQVNQEVKAIIIPLDALHELTEGEVNKVGMIAGRNVVGLRTEVHVLTVLAALASLFMIYHISARFRLEDKLAYQAGHDPLTGLAHRRLFERRLQTLPNHPHTIVLGTIDRFSHIVGGFGHAFGDQVMSGVAKGIREAAEMHGGEVYRLDGANIAVVYEMVEGQPLFNGAMQALQENVRRPFYFGPHEIFSTLSLGAAAYPRDGVEPDQLFRNADAALQAARRGGGDALVIYRPHLNAEAEERIEIESQLRHAIVREEFELHYQPQQCLKTGALIGFEALLRWRRGGLLVSPQRFIPVAEESALIIAIGDWVLEQAFRQASVLSASTESRLTIAVNISPRQFAHPAFFAKMKELIASMHIDPSLIELEITEGVMMENTEHAIGLLQRLRQLGMKLSIDDFGTGYSSLAYLKRFPVDKLKIDQSFLRQLTPNSSDSAIVQAIIVLGHSIGIKVIAEGVETQLQKDLLMSWGCDEIQGYLYGRPMSATASQGFADRQSRFTVPYKQLVQGLSRC